MAQGLNTWHMRVEGKQGRRGNGSESLIELFIDLPFCSLIGVILVWNDVARCGRLGKSRR